MSLKAPDDRKSSKARLNWRLRQIKLDDPNDLFIRLLWPGSSEDTTFGVVQLKEAIDVVDEGKSHLQVRGFHVFLSKSLGGRFAQQVNFITDLEALVPAFYADVGSTLTRFKRAAPKIKLEKRDAESVSVESLSKDAEDVSYED